MKNKILFKLIIVSIISFFTNLSFACSQADITAILDNEAELEAFAKGYGEARKAFDKLHMHSETCSRREDQAFDSAIDQMKRYEDSFKRMHDKKYKKLLNSVFQNTLAEYCQNEQEIDCWNNLQVIFDFSQKYGSFFRALNLQPNFGL